MKVIRLEGVFSTLGGHLSKVLFNAMLKSPPIKSKILGYLEIQCKRRVSKKKSFSDLELYPYWLEEK